MSQQPDFTSNDPLPSGHPMGPAANPSGPYGDQGLYPPASPYGTQNPYGTSPYGVPGQYGAQGPQHVPATYGTYGAAPYGHPYGHPYSVEHPQAQTVFILGIVGIFTGIPAFIAWYLGGQAKKEIEAGAPYPWEGKLKTGYLLGKVFGILSIVGFALGAVLWVLYLVMLFTLIGL